jgi:hypothetical protein
VNHIEGFSNSRGNRCSTRAWCTENQDFLCSPWGRIEWSVGENSLKNMSIGEILSKNSYIDHFDILIVSFAKLEDTTLVKSFDFLQMLVLILCHNFSILIANWFILAQVVICHTLPAIIQEQNLGRDDFMFFQSIAFLQCSRGTCQD